MLYGAMFYSINKNDIYKLRQNYAVGGGPNALINVKITIIECSIEAQLGRVLRAIYLKQDAGAVDRLLKELASVRKNYEECELRNQELLELVETLRSDLETANRRSSSVPAVSAPVLSLTPVLTLNDMIRRLSLEELTETANKVKEQIEDIRRCKICLSSCSVIMLLPCRHTCMCTSCNETHAQTDHVTCPVCRTPITDRINIYM